MSSKAEKELSPREGKRSVLDFRVPAFRSDFRVNHTEIKETKRLLEFNSKESLNTVQRN